MRIFILLLLAILTSCAESKAVTVTFASPPFSPDFIVNQAGNLIAIRYPGVTNVQYIPGTFGYISNQQVYIGTNSFSGGESSGITNAVYTNSGPDTVVIGKNVWLKTNSFGGGNGVTSFTTTNGNSIVIGSVGVIKTNYYISASNGGGVSFTTTAVPGGLQLGATVSAGVTGDVTGSGPVTGISATVTGLNGTSLAGLATGLMKITVGTGVPSSIATWPGVASLLTGLITPSAMGTGTPNALTFLRGDGFWFGAITNIQYTNSGPDIRLVDDTAFLNTNNIGGGPGGGGLNQLTGDVTAGPGTGSQVATLATVLVSPATYRSVTANSKGLVTAGSNPTTFSGYAISDSWANLGAVLTGVLPSTAFPALTGDITTSAGSVATALKNTGTAGTYRSTTFDAQGRETSGSNPTTFSGYAISDTWANFVSAVTGIPAFLTANQTITLSGDITGSGATAITTTLKNTGTAGTYRSVTFDAQGRETAGTLPTTFSAYGFADTWPNAAAALTGLIPQSALGTGSLGTGTKFLADDQTYKTVSGGGGGSGLSNQLAGAIQHLAFNLITNINSGNGSGMAVGDMNGDGIPDIVVDRNAATDVYTNIKNGTLFPLCSSFAQTSVAGGVSLADVQNDGRLDAIASSKGGLYVNVLTNDGTGKLTQLGGNYSIGGTAVNFITTYPAKLDGNNSVDFLELNGANPMEVWTNDGIGNFAVSTNLPAFLTSSLDAAVADMNGDGANDLILCPTTAINTSQFGFIVMTNNGSGVFLYWVTNILNASIGIASVAVGDFNGDGKLDIAALEDTGSPAVTVWTNNGTGFGIYSSNTVASAQKIAVADFNQDGKLDFIVTASSGATSVIFTNAGYQGLGNSFAAAVTNQQVSATLPIFTSTADFNGDGWPDYAVDLTSAGGVIAVWLNTPNIWGNFYGNAAGLTNGQMTLASGNSSSWTPSGVNGSLGTLQIDTNFLRRVAAFERVTQVGDASSLTNVQSVNGFTNAYFLAKSAAQTLAIYTTPNTTTNAYEIGGYLNVTAISVDVLAFQVVYTDELGASVTTSVLSGVAATGHSSVSTSTILCKPNTSITVQVALTTGTGSVTYNAEAFIRGASK